MLPVCISASDLPFVSLCCVGCLCVVLDSVWLSLTCVVWDGARLCACCVGPHMLVFIVLCGTVHGCLCVMWDIAQLSVLHGTVNGHLCVVWNSACLCVV